MSIKINENTSIGLPLRNLIGLIAAVVIGAWFAFGVIERLNALETANKLFEQDLLEASAQKPIDQEQFMLLEHIAEGLEKFMCGEVEAELEKNVDGSISIGKIIKAK
jgi:hypothetical protein